MNLEWAVLQEYTRKNSENKPSTLNFGKKVVKASF